MSDLQARLDAAIDAHRNGRVPEAEAGYAAVLAENPDHVHALSVSAILLVQKGDAEGAIARLRRALKLEPGNAAAHNNLGNILRQMHRTDEALEAYRDALVADPGFVDAVCNLGLIARTRGAIEDAAALFRRALEIDPDHIETNHNLGITYIMMKRPEDAADCFERCYSDGRIPVIEPTWHAQTLAHLGRRARAEEMLLKLQATRPDDPVIAHLLDAIRGVTTARASDAYVREHFDEFASDFDNTLAILNYKGPEIVAGLVARLCDGRQVKFLYDLGCGTGLAGPLVRPHCKVLIGIDLSPGMMVRAAKRDCYDELIEAEITATLNAVPEHEIDLAICVDTLIYFGDLAPVFAGLRRALKRGGAFIATVETHADDDPAGGVKILESGRYSHSAANLRQHAAASGLVLHALIPVTLREEYGQPVKGYGMLIENPA